MQYKLCNSLWNNVTDPEEVAVMAEVAEETSDQTTVVDLEGGLAEAEAVVAVVIEIIDLN